VKDLTLQKLATEAKVSYTTIQSTEQLGSDPHLSTLVKLATALGIEPADFLDSERFKAALTRLAEGK